MIEPELNPRITVDRNMRQGLANGVPACDGGWHIRAGCRSYQHTYSQSNI